MSGDWGPAESLRQIAVRLENRFQSLGGNQPATPKRVDPSWHNDMVRKANESFRTQNSTERVPVRKEKTRVPTGRTSSRSR